MNIDTLWKGKGDSVICFRCFKNFDKKPFQIDLFNSQLNSVEILHDPNDAVKVFYGILNGLLEKHASTKKNGLRIFMVYKWLTSEFFSAIREGDKLHKLGK